MQYEGLFSRGSRVPAAVLNRIQAVMSGLKRATGYEAGALDLTGEDGRYWPTPTAGVPDGTLVVVDASIDWRNRALRGTFTRLTAADQRLQGSAAWKRNDPSQALAVRAFDDAWTGAGAVASAGVPPPISSLPSYAVILDELSAGADRVFLFADSANDGRLTLYNGSGATLHGELKVWGAGASSSGPGTLPTVPGFLFGDVDTADATWTTVVTLTPGASSSVVLVGTVAAITSDGGDGGAWTFAARVRRGAAGNPSVGTAVFSLAEYDGTGWGVRVQASGGDVVVQVQGEAATDLTWRAEIQTTEAKIS